MNLREMLIRHEGIRLKPYLDTTNNVSIGVGRNLTSRGITQAEAMAMLDHDIAVAALDVRSLIGDEALRSLDEVRRAVLVSMSFNLGRPRLAKFKGTLAAIKTGDWDLAAKHMLNSAWAGQVGNRAVELAEMMRTGEWLSS